MNKTELIAAAAEKSGLSKKDTVSALNAVLEAVNEELSAGGKVAIVGFGSFDVKQRDERTGRNPATGEAITIAASRTPVFKPGKALKDAVAK